MRFLLVVALMCAGCEVCEELAPLPPGDVDQPQPAPDEGFTLLPLRADITDVQPQTGIVLWDGADDDEDVKRDGTIALEYAYMKPSDVAVAADPSGWDWSGVDALLDRVASRGHQSIIRFYYVYPGEETAVPDYIKQRNDYFEATAEVEGQNTFFPSWGNAELQRFHLEFYTELAARYDDDPRLAFLQVGFGLWAEYHLYGVRYELGVQFPTKAFQQEFFAHMSEQFHTLKWSVSIDAADDAYSPLAETPSMLALDFGLFDDSFMSEEHAAYNAVNWSTLQFAERFKRVPHGGELSYYSDFDQAHALDVQGIYGRTFEELASQFHLSYMIGADQPQYQSPARIKEAGRALGYAFEIVGYSSSLSATHIDITNTGIAPLYYDAFVVVAGVASTASLAGLLPGEVRRIEVPTAATATSAVRISGSRLVAGQTIQFRARLTDTVASAP
jgi:hypothetical protein